MYNNYNFKRDVLRFKHFSRKGYALFACLGRVVLVGVLSVATLQNAKASGISIETYRADNDTIPTDREFDLSEVEVSGTRAPLSAGQAARMVTVLRAQDIQGAAVQSVNDLLKLCVGVDVRQRAPMGAQTDISMRGGTSEHIAILLDGICISDPQTGHNALDLPIQLSQIERIEVLEGPAARVYGAQSLLGAINIVTKNPLTPQGGTSNSLADVFLEGGSYGYLNAGGVLNAPVIAERLTNSVSGSYARSDGFNRSKANHLNNDYEGGKLFYQGSYSFNPSVKSNKNLPLGGKEGVISWNLGYAQKCWGSSTSYGLGSDEQYERTRKMYASVSGNFALGKNIHIKPAAYWQRNNDWYKWVRATSRPNINRTDVFGANLNVWFDWALGRTTAGYEIKNEDLLSGNLGEPIEPTHKIPGTEDRYYDHGLNRTNHSWHLEHNVVYKNLTVSAGLMALRNTWNDMPYHVYPGIDAAYQLGSNWKVYASWNTSMRLPTYTELYYKVDGHLADKNLLPEEMSAFEIGTKYASRFGQSSISLYKHNGTNMIDWILDTNLPKDDQVWSSVNHTKLDSYGVELNSRWNMRQVLPSQRLLKTLSFGYSYIHQEQKENAAGILSRYTLEYLRNKAVAGAVLSLVENTCMNLDLSLNWRYQDRIGSYTNAAGELKKYSPYSVFDARLDCKMKHYGLYLEMNNIFNKSYMDYGNVIQPGTWFIAGVKVTL
ncbi:MAG: TonB-dependent receptor [Bacteroidaceae bacterium]|nr:TonB-dependent receptor [Bacteroidaceae bacterium]